MSSAENKAVFLSYASQDAAAAKRLCEALRAAGVEVWFDQSELTGGDAWDQKIRRHIKECALFVPIISANTQARTEGYFRLEWRLADQRTHLMAKGRPFLLPVVIDDTRDADAHVPDSFTEVQWTRLNVKDTPESLAARVARLLGGGDVAQASPPAVLPDAGGTPALPRKRATRSWLIPASIMVALSAAIAAYIALRPHHNPEEIAQPSPVIQAAAANAAGKSTPAATAPLTDTQSIVERIWAIYDKINDGTPEEWALGEELGAQATKLEPLNADAWAAWSLVGSLPRIFSFDDSSQRLVRITQYAERAISIAPENVNARTALANCRRLTSRSLVPEAVETMRTLVPAQPRNRRVLRMAGNVYRYAQRFDEAIGCYDAAAALPGGDPIALLGKSYALREQGRIDEGEAAIDRSLALHDAPGAKTEKLMYLVFAREDYAAAAALIATLPRSFLLRPECSEAALFLWLQRREFERCLELLDEVPWQEMSGVPKAVVRGTVYRAGGRMAAARAQWQGELPRMDAKLGANPSDKDALFWKIYLLASLGRGAEAEPVLETFDQLTGQVSIPRVFDKGALLVMLGRTEEGLQMLQRAASAPPDRQWAMYVRMQMRTMPDFEAVRTDPRFSGIIEQLTRFVHAESGPANASESPASAEKSVAVLAFADLSAAHDSEYFSDGISEELLNVLAKVPGLKVTARTSSFFFKGKQVPIPEIAQKLGVAYVIEGSVQRAGDQIKITAQLIKAADGFHVWSDTFKRDAKDVFAVEEEIAGLIAKRLSLRLGMSAEARRETTPEAYALYLQAMQKWNRRYSAGRFILNDADVILQRVVTLDPEFASAHALLAMVRDYTVAGNSAYDEAGKMDPGIAAALAQAERSVQLAPARADAHVALGALYAEIYRNKEAEAEYQRAIEIAPGDYFAHARISRLLETEGRMDEALAHLRRATELDPLATRPFDNLALMLAHAGRWQEGLRAAERAVALAPENEQALIYKTVLLLNLGRTGEAKTVMQHLLAIEPDPATSQNAGAYFCAVLSELGQRKEAEAIYARIPTNLAAERIYAAAVLKRFDDVRKILASTWLARDWSDELMWSPVFDPVRETSEFRQMLQRHGLIEAHARAQAWRAAHPPEKVDVKK